MGNGNGERKLVAAGLKNLRPGRHGDGGGLSLLVKPSGARSWTVRVTIDGKRVDRGLGKYPKVSLAEARRKAEVLRSAAAEGIEVAQPKPVQTFGDAARIVSGTLEGKWRDPVAAGRQFRRSLELHAGPLMGRPVTDITRADVLEVLRPIWNDKPATAQRVRQRIKVVMMTVMAYDETITSNPAGEGIDGVLKSWTPARRTVNHHRAVAADAVAAALPILPPGPRQATPPEPSPPTTWPTCSTSGPAAAARPSACACGSWCSPRPGPRRHAKPAGPRSTSTRRHGTCPASA